MSRVLTLALVLSAACFTESARAGSAGPAADPATAEPTEIPAMFRDAFPDRVARLERMSHAQPAAYHRILRRMGELAREFDRLKRTDREEFEHRWAIVRLETETDELADRWREAKTDPEKTRLGVELEAKLGALFDAKEAERNRRIERLEGELKELRAKQEQRRALRTKVIKKRLEEMKGGEELEF